MTGKKPQDQRTWHAQLLRAVRGSCVGCRAVKAVLRRVAPKSHKPKG